MIMLFAIIIVTSIGAIILLTTIIGMTLDDIHSVKRDREFQNHPYARKWRQRPLVSVLIDGEPSDACLKSIRKNKYRKIEIVHVGQNINGELLLTLSPDTVIGPTAINEAVKRFSSNPSVHSLELIPIFDQPHTLREFFIFYQRIASAPFIATRAGLNIHATRSSWPTMARLESIPVSRFTQIYRIVRWLASVANLFTLLSLIYIAITFYEPEFLLLYLAVFGAWLFWAISRYHHLHFRYKLLYAILAPASLLYFVIRSLLNPFRFRAVLS